MRPSRYPCAVVLACVLGMVAGCGAPGVPVPPSLELPQRVNDLRAVRKSSQVFLAWTVPTRSTDGRTIRNPGKTLVCRNLDSALTECGNAVGELPPSKATSIPRQTPAPEQDTYTDTLSEPLQQQHPTGNVIYAVVVRNEQGRSAGLSNQVAVPSAPTLAPPQEFHAGLQSSGIRLSWSPVSQPSAIPGLQYSYRIYRREKSGSNDIKLADLPLDSGASEFLDHSFEWEKTYVYHLTIVTQTLHDHEAETQVEGDNTPDVEVFAHDVFPPAVPTALQAVASGEGQPPFIDLIWSPDTDADLAGYNVYRRQEGGQAIRVNSAPVQTPAYRDTTALPGHSYIYSVSAVDLRGNESGRSTEASETVP